MFWWSFCSAVGRRGWWRVEGVRMVKEDEGMLGEEQGVEGNDDFVICTYCFCTKRVK